MARDEAKDTVFKSEETKVWILALILTSYAILGRLLYLFLNQNGDNIPISKLF